MPIFLRQIRMRRWIGRSPEWLPEGSATADEVSDLPTIDNALSVFRLPDDAEGAPMRVAVAIVALRTQVDDFEYCEVNEEAFTRAGVELQQTAAKTPDGEVNGWHYDVVRLTAPALASVAYELRGLEKLRVLKEDLVNEVLAALLNGRFGLSEAPNLQGYLRKKGLI